MSFKFELDTKVIIEVSGEEGIVTGRAEYLLCENQYFLLYKDAAGKAVERWWSESALILPM